MNLDEKYYKFNNGSVIMLSNGGTIMIRNHIVHVFQSNSLPLSNKDYKLLEELQMKLTKEKEFNDKINELLK